MGKKNVQPFNLETAWPSHRCETIREYLQVAYGKLEKEGAPHAFRGVTCRYSNLWPSFDRRKTPNKDRGKIETDLLKEFIHRAWTYLTPEERLRSALTEKRWGSKRNMGTLVVARHRLLPTRCVDWSYTPLCALFFACEAESQSDGEVWWFDRSKFDHCVAPQWPSLFGKRGYVEPDIEKEFIAGHDKSWFTGLDYGRLRDDRLDLQDAWITVAGRLGTCHAEEIDRLGASEKGRLVIPARLKTEAIEWLERVGITRGSLGLNPNHPADQIATRIRDKFETEYARKDCAVPAKPVR